MKVRSPSSVERGARQPGQPSLKARALRLLSMRDHSRAELLKKLIPHALEGDDVEALVAGLVSAGWVDDARVAESLARRRGERLGAARLKQELKAKGLSTDLVVSALAAVADTELVRAQQVWQKKFGQPAETFKEKASQQRFLLIRGFSPDVVRQVIKTDGRTDDPGWSSADD